MGVLGENSIVDEAWGYSRVQRLWDSKGILRLLWKSSGEAVVSVTLGPGRNKHKLN